MHPGGGGYSVEDSKTSSHPKQNKNLKEVPIHGTFDTAGFLYSPYRAEFDEQTKTVLFTTNTLRDIIRDELLNLAVIWLLGYDARKPLDKQINDASIRAQAEGSHWETAWCVIHFLDARPILADKYPAIVREIDRRLCSPDPNISPLAWLLAPTEVIDLGEEQIRWYGKEYDTAVVTLALLRANAEYHSKLCDQIKTRLDQLVPKALRWLYAHLEQALAEADVDVEAVTILEPLIYADGHFASLLSEVWPDNNASMRKELYAALDKCLAYFEARLTPHNEDDALTHFIYGVNGAYYLCRLVFVEQSANLHARERFRPFVERAKILLLHYIEFVEKWLAKDQWGGSLNQIWQLGTYVDACAVTSRSNQENPATATTTSTASAEVVLKVLSLVKNEFFSNGSIYHSIYPTVYFLRSLISVWNWPDAGKTIARLYHDLLDKFVIKLSVERKEIFELSRILVERERDLTNEKERYRKLLIRERKKRYGLLAFVFVSLSAAVIYISYILSPQNVISNAGLVMTALAIILTLIEVLFLRES
jgi:hypothetical protein